MRMALIALCSFALAAAQAPDMSGTWQLNVERSSWGKHPKPTSGTVMIEHHEPVFKYSGTVTVNNGTETTPGDNRFTFNGAIDGKEYPVSGSAGGAKMTIRRVDGNTIQSELRSSEGAVIEPRRRASPRTASG